MSAPFSSRTQQSRYKFLTASKDDPDKPEEDRKAVDTLLNKEKSRQLSRSLRHIKNQPHLGAISKVEVETTTGSPPTTYDTQATVEQAIMESLDARYHMSHHSQFLQSPLLELIGPTATSPAAQKILDGTFQCPEGVDETTHLMIQLLQRPDRGAHCIETSISAHDFRHYWK
jgi:hypothetical protein